MLGHSEMAVEEGCFNLPTRNGARVLLSSVFGPYCQDDKYGSRAINPMELFHNQVTREQGSFSLRVFHPSRKQDTAGKKGRLGAVALVRARDRVGVTACCWLRGEHQQEFSATRRYWLLAERGIQSSLVPGVRKS